jgi:Sigma-70, region 4
MLADEPKTLDELAREYRVSRERIRQIEQRAFEWVKSAVRARVAEASPGSFPGPSPAIGLRGGRISMGHSSGP